MGQIKRTKTDLHPDLKKRGNDIRRSELKRLLRDPSASKTARKKIHDELKRLADSERGA